MQKQMRLLLLLVFQAMQMTPQQMRTAGAGSAEEATAETGAGAAVEAGAGAGMGTARDAAASPRRSARQRSGTGQISTAAAGTAKVRGMRAAAVVFELLLHCECFCVASSPLYAVGLVATNLWLWVLLVYNFVRCAVLPDVHQQQVVQGSSVLPSYALLCMCVFLCRQS
jgi:hypothetical protein